MKYTFQYKNISHQFYVHITIYEISVNILDTELYKTFTRTQFGAAVPSNIHKRTFSKNIHM